MARQHARAAFALALMLLVALSAAASEKREKKQKAPKANKKGRDPAPAVHVATLIPRTSGDSDVSAPVEDETRKWHERLILRRNKDKQKKVESDTGAVSTALVPVAATPEKKRNALKKVVNNVFKTTGDAVKNAGGKCAKLLKGKKSRRDDTNSQGVGDRSSSEDGHSSRTYTPSTDTDEERDAREDASVVSAPDDHPVPLNEGGSTSDHGSATHLSKRTEEQSKGVTEREACIPVSNTNDGTIVHEEREAADLGSTANPDDKSAAEKSDPALNPGLIATGAIGTFVAVPTMAWLRRALKRRRGPPRKAPVPARQGVLPRLTKQTGLLFAVPTLAVAAYGLLSSRAASATVSSFPATPSKPGAKPGARTIWGMPVWLAIALGFAACVVAVSLITFAIVGVAHKLCPCWF